MLNTTSSSRFFLCKKNSCGVLYRKICSHCKTFLYFFIDIFSIGEMYPNSRKRTTGTKISQKKSIQYIQKEKGFLKNNARVISIMLWILGIACRKKCSTRQCPYLSIMMFFDISMYFGKLTKRDILSILIVAFML